MFPQGSFPGEFFFCFAFFSVSIWIKTHLLAVSGLLSEFQEGGSFYVFSYRFKILFITTWAFRWVIALLAKLTIFWFSWKNKCFSECKHSFLPFLLRFDKTINVSLFPQGSTIWLKCHRFPRTNLIPFANDKLKKKHFTSESTNKLKKGRLLCAGKKVQLCPSCYVRFVDWLHPHFSWHIFWLTAVCQVWEEVPLKVGEFGRVYCVERTT